MHKVIPLFAAVGLIAACTATAQSPAEVAAEAPPAAYASPPPVAPVAPVADAPAYAAYHAPASEAPFSCEVRTRRTANGVLITGLVRADDALAGDYEMIITKSGGGNSSDIAQSGPFVVDADGAAALGESEISLERGARLRVTLTLTTEDGRTCRRTFRS